MRCRELVAAAVVASALVAGCSDDSSKSAAPSSTTAARGASASTTVVSLPAGIAKSEQFCSLTSALADKFRGVAQPSTPAELLPYIRELIAFLQQAAPVAPKELLPDVQKLNTFYSDIANRISSTGQGSTGQVVSDAPASSGRLRQYFKTICGVDDQVFNL